MKTTLDCRGLACPQPVVRTKKALEGCDGDGLVVMVDNPSSCDNVERFARAQGCLVEIERREGDFCLHLQRRNDAGAGPAARPARTTPRVVIYINSDLLGGGEEALGAFLMKSFLKTLGDLETKPSRLVLINSGVRLASEESRVLEHLKTLSDGGVEIVCCGTCLDFYKLREKLAVGTISNMYDILQSLVEADQILRP